MKSFNKNAGIVIPSTLKYCVITGEIAGLMKYKFDNGPHCTSIVKIFVVVVIS